MADGIIHPSIVLREGFGASLAMGISEVMGTCLTRRAEQIRENANNETGRVRMYTENLFWALVDGPSSALVTLIAIVPFLLVLKYVISIELAFISSVIIIGVELFVLGAFLVKIAGKSIILHGLITLFAGIAIFLVVSALSF